MTGINKERKTHLSDGVGTQGAGLAVATPPDVAFDEDRSKDALAKMNS